MSEVSKENATEFEKKRGVNRIEVRHGYAQVHVSRIERELVAQRLNLLESISSSGVSIDFLKFTPTGFSFIVPEDRAESVETALATSEVHFTIRKGRSIVLVHAVNIRDEEGMIAKIIGATIGSGAKIDHIGDMHDRMLLVIRSEDVERVTVQFRNVFGNGGPLEVSA